jgi:hypothetical protein
MRISVVVAVFAAGFLFGSIAQRSADAQLKDLGSQALKQAEGGGAGSVLELGTAIVDMEQHVNGLQKNLDTLKKIKSALGG